MSYSKSTIFRDYGGICSCSPVVSKRLQFWENAKQSSSRQNNCTVKDDTVGENFLMDKRLNKEKHIDIGRDYITTKQQTQNISLDTHKHRSKR